MSLNSLPNPKTSNTISIRGARQHNLKNLDIDLPKNALVVLTGLSGSGKSSLAFDTLYAEGQRRYVESLSSYARQFLGVMDKPDVDHIEGLSPAISIDQKTTSHNPRSTVGTITEIYDYLRLLYARVGRPHCPQCGREVSTQSIDQIITHVMEEIESRINGQPIRLMIMSPVVRSRKGEFSGLLETLRKKGYQRARIDKSFYSLDDEISLLKNNKHSICIVIDRLTISKVEWRDESSRKNLRSRLAQSLEEALKLADGTVVASFVNDPSLQFPDAPTDYEDRLFSEQRACSHCGISLPELEPRLFSFNSPQGACPTCNGLGTLLKVEPTKILAPSLSLSEGAIVPFARVMSTDSWWARLVKEVVESAGYDFRTTPFESMDSATQELLLHGSPKIYRVVGENRLGKETVIHEKFEGFISNLERRFSETESEFIRQEISQFMSRRTCPACHGARLKDEALGVKIDGLNISELTHLPIDQAQAWIGSLGENHKLNLKEATIGAPILKEISARLGFLNAVGLNYLSLDREAATLAGGEAQRIRLASQIGTGLSGVLYILDEPTIGLHQRDNFRLIKTLQELRDKGNTVIVVEHDRDVMLAADHLVDIGPGAGKLGGELIAQGTAEHIMSQSESITGQYLSRRKDIHRRSQKKSAQRRVVTDDDLVVTGQQLSGQISIYGATQHNLDHLDVNIPLNQFVCITGVSGSGKSTLLHDTLYYQLAKHLGKSLDFVGTQVERLVVPEGVKRLSLIDQSPIGRTPRSNPATYTKIFDYIRNLFATTKDAKLRGYKPGRFSFNVKGGRCEACQGDGQLKIEMQFLPDVYVTCDVCHGQRYNEETLEVSYRDKNIAQVLKLNVDEAFQFFQGHSLLRKKLKTLQDVGLGYIELGQPAPTLSGGEAQRIKLSRELSTRTMDHVVYLLDEPTTGLHFADVQKLLDVLDQLVAQNNTVVVIEHNLDIIKNADWIIDLGPEGGAGGGQVVAEGTPSTVAQNPNSFTGHYLQTELKTLKQA